MRLEIKGEYPPEWETLSYAVKVAAGWRCIRCGHLDPRRGREWAGLPPLKDLAVAACDDRCTHPADYSGKLRMLTVHHLDGNKANLHWWNLLALCQACHLSVQARVIPDRPWLWPHSEWFKVYVAGFYAAYYGGLFLSRDEVQNRLDELLRLGQPWTVPTFAKETA